VIGTYQVKGFVDDGVKEGEIVMGVPILGSWEILPGLYDQGIRMAVNAVGGIGNIGIRENVFNRLLRAGFGCPILVHPRAFVEASAAISAGAQIFPLAYVGSEVRVGFGAIVNTAAVVSHECVLGDLVNIAPQAVLAGGVIVGARALIGMGATVNLSVTIGEGARIGNGATVKTDVPPQGVVPAGTTWPR
jgi:sugar O-acyltransferase (sialic acid O-acetyltransferase NeuD family)